MFHKTWNLFKLSEQSLENSAKNSVILSFDQSRVPFDWSNALFDQSNRNRIAIESSKDSRIDFLTISIDQAKVSTDWKYWISNFHLENFRTWIFTLLTSWNNTLQTQTSLLQLIHVYTYIYNKWHSSIHSVYNRKMCKIYIVLPKNNSHQSL